MQNWYGITGTYGKELDLKTLNFNSCRRDSHAALPAKFVQCHKMLRQEWLAAAQATECSQTSCSAAMNWG